MRIEADLDLCQGHGMCAVEAPEVFALGKGDDQVRILRPEPGEPHLEAVQNAVRYCPAMALTLHE